MARCTSSKKGVHLELEANEVDLMRFMGKELRRLLEKSKDDGGVPLQSFSPTLQLENDFEAEPCALMGEMEKELILHRLNRIEEMQADLLDGTEEGRVELHLDETRADLWLAYLSDIRLLLAEVIGITPLNPDPFSEQDPDDWTLEMKMYEFLSVLQELILDVVN